MSGDALATIVLDLEIGRIEIQILSLSLSGDARVPHPPGKIFLGM